TPRHCARAKEPRLGIDDRRRLQRWPHPSRQVFAGEKQIAAVRVARRVASQLWVVGSRRSVRRLQLGEWIGGKSFASNATRAYEEKISLQVFSRRNCATARGADFAAGCPYLSDRTATPNVPPP